MLTTTSKQVSIDTTLISFSPAIELFPRPGQSQTGLKPAAPEKRAEMKAKGNSFNTCTQYPLLCYCCCCPIVSNVRTSKSVVRCPPSAVQLVLQCSVPEMGPTNKVLSQNQLKSWWRFLLSTLRHPYVSGPIPFRGPGPGIEVR